MKAENPPALERWLYWATMDLSDESKARVRAEIETHYREAVEDQLEERKTDEVAHRLALSSLGDHYTASLSFNRAYLTKEDLQMIRGLRGEALPSEVSADIPLKDLKPLAWVAFFLSIPIVIALAQNPTTLWTTLRYGLYAVAGLVCFIAVISPLLMFERWVFKRLPLRKSLPFFGAVTGIVTGLIYATTYGLSAYFTEDGNLHKIAFLFIPQAVGSGFFSFLMYQRLSRKVAQQEKDLRKKDKSGRSN